MKNEQIYRSNLHFVNLLVDADAFSIFFQSLTDV